MNVPCQTIPRNKKRSNPSSSSHSLTSNMKRTKTTDDSKMLVFNLPPNTGVPAFADFLCWTVWEKHGERVDVVHCRVWHSSDCFASVLVEFRDPRQRDIALMCTNGVLFYGNSLRAGIFEQRDDGHKNNAKNNKKKSLCRYFTEGRCFRSKEQCSYAHGVLDLKLYKDTWLHKDRCLYINQIDSRFSGIDLLNLIRGKFDNEHRGEPQLMITALHYRQQMGDALIEFGTHTLKSMAYDLLNGLEWGSQTLDIHPWESRYKEIFLDYFDRDIQTEIKVHNGITPAAQAGRMQVRTSGHIIDPVVVQRMQVPIGDLDPNVTGNDCPANSGGENLDHSREDDGSVSTSCTMESVSTDNNDPEVSDTTTGRESRKFCTTTTTRPVEDIVRNWLIADKAKEPADSRKFQHQGTLDSGPSEDDLQAVSPLQPFGDNRNQEDREPGAVQLQDTAVTDQQDVANKRVVSQDQDGESEVQQPDNCPQDRIAETIKGEPREPEPTESQQDENNSDLLEASNEAVQGSELSGDYQPLETDNSLEEGLIEEEPREHEPTESQENENRPDMLEASNEVMQDSERREEYQSLRGTSHPAPADDPEIDRMRKEIAKLKSEQAEKDQLIEDLKKENANMGIQLDASRTDARLHLEKLSEEQRKLSEMEEEVDRLRREVTNDLLPKLKRKEEQTKQLKIEVYDLLKVRGDVLAEIKKLSGGHDRIKSDQDNSVSGNDHVSEDHTAINFSTILEVQKYLDEASAYVKEKEAETERLRDENTTLEEEMEQMRMCRAMEMGFVAGKGPDGDGA